MAFTLETATLNGLPNNIGKPGGFASAPALSYPSLIHLHGSGGRGDTLPQALTRDAPTPISEINAGNFKRDSDGGDWEFLVFNPVLASGDWTLAAAEQAMDGVINNASTYKIDINQIYLTGLSLGGIGIHAQMTLWPAYFRYRALKGMFPVSGANLDINDTQAQYCVDRGMPVLRGWYGADDPNAWVVGGAAGMPPQRDIINTKEAGYYELYDIYRSFNYTVESGGPFQVGEIITWGSGTGTGRLIRLTDNGTTGKLWVTFASGSAPSNTDSLSGGTSSATATINSVPATFTHSTAAWGTPYQDHSSSDYTIYHEIELLNNSSDMIGSANGTSTAVATMKQDQKIIGVAMGTSTANGVLTIPSAYFKGKASKQVILI